MVSFPSLERIVPGMEEAREAFPGKGKEKDHLKDVFDWKSLLFVQMAFSKQLVQFELLHKGGNHW